MAKSWMVGVAAVALAACGGGDGGGGTDADLAALQGDWTRCDNFGANDASETMTFSGNSVVVVQRDHGTSDFTCGDAGTVVATTPGTFVLGGTSTATMRLSGATVTARNADVTLQGQPTFYTIIYVNTAATPDLLYTADYSDAQHDGTTPAKRHNVLNDEGAFAKR